MSAGELDPRVERGMKRQLEMRLAALEAGQTPLGWKIGFGSPAAMKRLGIDRPLVGFLVKEAVLASGSTLSPAGWTKVLAEPEVAVYIGQDLTGRVDRESARSAISSVGPAIELADVTFPPDEVEEILACDIYQRHVLLGRRDETRSGGRLDGLMARVSRNGAEVAATGDLEALTGDLLDNVVKVSELLSRLGMGLRAGEVIITGSVVPPIEADARTVIGYELAPIDRIQVTFGA